MQKHETAPGNTGNNWTAVYKTSYRLNYKYEGIQPHAPSTIIDEPNLVPTTTCCDPNNPEVNFANYGYDKKGNPLYIEKNTCNVGEDDRAFMWDEENRLRFVDTSPSTPEVDGSAIYTYDAGGERIIKQLLSSEILDFKNGLTTTVDSANSITATIYPNGLISARLQYEPGDGYNGTYIIDYTKHYFAGTQRITGKLGEGSNFGAFNCSWLIIPFGNGGAPVNEKDKALAALTTANAAVLALMQSKGITPPPGFGQNAGYTGNCVSSYTGPEENHVYWYHPDHLGSSSFITGIDGEVTQNIEYFPSGETFVENHLNSYNTPYLYNSKELDDETGYYYYGARYYNPRVSLWLNVDPIAEKFPGRSPYEYTFSNPINLIDPTGMGPELPNLNAVRKIYSFNSNIFYSLYYSNNTSNKQLYEWANGNASSGKNKLKGAIGEAIAMDDIDGYTGALTGFIGWDDASFGKYYNGYQVDIQRVVKTGFKKLYADRGINVIYFANFNNFYGSSFTSEFGDGVKKQNFTFNYEVKTLSANTENTGNIYSNLVKGVDQTIKRTNLKNNFIGVLMVDKDAWLKVASDSTYGPKLKEQYDLMRKSGGQLQLNEGLNSRAEKALHSLGDKLKK